MYAVCQLFPPRFGSFVHSSLQICRCFIKHNTKKYFYKLCQNLHISQPIFVWTVPLYVVPYYPKLYTVIYSTIILRCLKDAVNFAWLFGNYTKSECSITNLWAKHVLFENFITKDSRLKLFVHYSFCQWFDESGVRTVFLKSRIQIKIYFLIRISLLKTRVGLFGKYYAEEYFLFMFDTQSW